MGAAANRVIALALCASLSGVERADAENQGLVVRDGSLGRGAGAVAAGVDPNGRGADYLIGPELGAQRGENLFHSFERFGVGPGETATFTGPDPIGAPQSIERIIGRVTGGHASSIDGTLRSTIPGADVYLANPSGIVFGPDAQLDVSGSFHATTADSIEFADGARLEATAATPPVLTTAPPAAFGFLGAGPGTASLSVTGAKLDVPKGESLSLAARDRLEVTDAKLLAPNGRIDLAAAASRGALPIASTDSSAVPTLGDVALANAHINAGGDAPGAISIRSGRLVAERGTQVLTENHGTGAGGRIDIEARSSAVVDASLFSVSTDKAGDAGTVRVEGGAVSFRNGPGLVDSSVPLEQRPDAPLPVEVGATAETRGAGRGGTLEIESDSLDVTSGATLSAQTVGDAATGDAGTIRIRTGTMRLSDRVFVTAGAWSSLGDAGRIEVDADTISIDGARGYALITTTSVAGPFGRIDDFTVPGAPGSIDINAGLVEVLRGGSIQSACRECDSTRVTRSSDAATLRIRADRMLVDGSNPNDTSFVSVEALGGAGDAGTLLVDVSDSLLLTNGGYFSTAAIRTPGDAGAMHVSAGSLVMSGQGTYGISVLYANWSGLYADWAWPLGFPRPPHTSGHAGAISIDVGSLDSREGARIAANSENGGSRAGTISIRADDSISFDNEGGLRFVLSEALLVPNLPPQLNGVFAASLVGGHAGAITMDAPDIRLANGAFVSTSVFNGGDSGTIALAGERIGLRGGAFLDDSNIRLSRDRLPGAAGSIELTATEWIQIIGADALHGDPSRIASASVGAGGAGSVLLDAPRIVLDGGAVAISTMPGVEAAGSPGVIRLTGDELVIRNGGRVDASTFVDGPGGRIEMTARESLRIEGAGSGVASRTGGAGAGGDLLLRAPRIDVVGGGAVSTRSAAGLDDLMRVFGQIETYLVEPDVASGRAGAIALDGDRVRLVGGSLASDSAAADGGEIAIRAGERVHMVGAEITAAARDGTGGNIIVASPLVLLENSSRIVANAGRGSGGNIAIAADHFFAFPDSVVDASSELGVDGLVVIRGADAELAGQVTPLPASFLDAAPLLRERCAARSSGERAGSFSVRGRGGIAPEPDGWLPAAANFEGSPPDGAVMAQNPALTANWTPWSCRSRSDGSGTSRIFAPQ